MLIELKCIKCGNNLSGGFGSPSPSIFIEPCKNCKLEPPKTEREMVCDEIIEGLKTYSTLFGTYNFADIMIAIKRVRNK